MKTFLDRDWVRIPWTLDDGIAFARQLEIELGARFWHCAIGGSVLHKGASDKDLDVVCFPRKANEPPQHADRTRALRRMGCTRELDRADVRRSWRERGILDTKHVEVWACPLGRRIDIMVLQ